MTPQCTRTTHQARQVWQGFPYKGARGETAPFGFCSAPLGLHPLRCSNTKQTQVKIEGVKEKKIETRFARTAGKKKSVPSESAHSAKDAKKRH